MLLSFLALLFCSIGVSCSSEFNDHYNPDDVENSGLDLLDYLKSRDELSTFVNMLEITGYADTLKRSQSFTVFAPTNQALAGIDMADLDGLKLLVGNHLTSYTQTFPAEISAFNGKSISLERVAGQYLYGNANSQIEIAQPNLRAKNGIVHIMDNYLPYSLNIWEYIQKNKDLDSIRSYINSLTVTKFDREASFDDNGIFIDSVFSQSNKVFDYLGHINAEGYNYTAILPANVAWSKTYDKIFPFFKSRDKIVDGTFMTGVQRQIDKTKWAILQDFLFDGKIQHPTNRDSLISTGGTLFKDPDYLFEGAQLQILSNGYGYLTNEMKNKLSDSWVKPIAVEAEQNDYSLRSKSANYNLNEYSSLGTNFKASANRYVRFENLPASDFSYAWARFPIPNTLANVKYNIYCVFIPVTAIDTTDTRPYKLKFYLSYVDAQGAKIVDKAISVPNNVTEKGKVTKLLIAENFQFPYSDLVEFSSNSASEYANDINVFLKVENAATIKEERRGTYSRNVAIDRVILEPVIE